MQLNLELSHRNTMGTERVTYPIERPEGFDDEAYRTHADGAAELVRTVLTGSPGDLLRVTGVTMMVVQEGIMTEYEIAAHFRAETRRQTAADDWREAHVIQLAPFR